MAPGYGSEGGEIVADNWLNREYFNGLPGGRERPWEWARGMTGLLRGDDNHENQGGKMGEDGRRGSERGEGGIVKFGHGKEERLASTEVDPDEEGEGKGMGDAPVPRDFEYHSDGNDS